MQVFGNPNQSGPFGYVDKGTFFTDESFTEFPEKIEVVFQVLIPSTFSYRGLFYSQLYCFRVSCGPFTSLIQLKGKLHMEEFTTSSRTKLRRTPFNYGMITLPEWRAELRPTISTELPFLLQKASSLDPWVTAEARLALNKKRYPHDLSFQFNLMKYRKASTLMSQHLQAMPLLSSLAL